MTKAQQKLRTAFKQTYGKPVKENDGGPAFPTGLEYREIKPSAGMTIRDYFAAKETLAEWNRPEACMTKEMAEALAGEKQPEGGWGKDFLGMLRFEAKWRAALKYIRADAMIAEREKGQR